MRLCGGEGAAARQVPTPVVTFRHSETGEGEYQASVNEGDSLTVTLKFNPSLDKDTSIRWLMVHANGAQGIAGTGDFVYGDRNSDRDIALTAGASEATFTIQTIEDSELEGNETFQVALCGPPPRCEWPSPPREPHPSRQRIMDQLEASKHYYQDVANGPVLVVTIVDDDAEEPEASSEEDSRS